MPCGRLLYHNRAREPFASTGFRAGRGSGPRLLNDRSSIPPISYHFRATKPPCSAILNFASTSSYAADVSSERERDSPHHALRPGVFVVAAALLVYQIGKSPYVTRAFEARQQPIQFSHERHVGGQRARLPLLPHDGRDVGGGGHPADQDLHELPLADLARAARTSSRSGRATRNDVSIQWVRVHDLPDFVYFDHSIHVNKGVGCTTCHGRVDQMPLMWHGATRSRWSGASTATANPEKYVRPRRTVFKVDYQPPADQLGARRRRLVKDYQVRRLTSCSTCHR